MCRHVRPSPEKVQADLRRDVCVSSDSEILEFVIGQKWLRASEPSALVRSLAHALRAKLVSPNVGAVSDPVPHARPGATRETTALSVRTHSDRPHERVARPAPRSSHRRPPALAHRRTHRTTNPRVTPEREDGLRRVRAGLEPLGQERPGVQGARARRRDVLPVRHLRE